MKMAMARLLVLLVLVSYVSAQLAVFNVQGECGNINAGTCRLQCLSTELSVYPASCSYYTSLFGLYFNRCANSMPCCYWSGNCQTSCNSSQTQLTSAATCSTSGNVCCIPRINGATSGTTGTGATTTTTTTTTTLKTTKQGVCGTLGKKKRSIAPRILGGYVAQSGSWPWMVRLTYTTTTGFCAGVLVDADTVLTPAHCVAGVPAGNMRAIVGDYNPSIVDTDEETVYIREYWLASGFIRGNRGNDFAVLKLSKNVTFTSRKLPVCLLDPSIPLASPQQCYIAGWGVSEAGWGGPLREANVVLLDRTTCQNRLAAAGVSTTLPTDMLCTENLAMSPTDGCIFDDGDMLVCLDTRYRWSLIGLMSEYSCGNMLPPLFTDVSVYLDNILSRL